MPVANEYAGGGRGGKGGKKQPLLTLPPASTTPASTTSSSASGSGSPSSPTGSRTSGLAGKGGSAGSGASASTSSSSSSYDYAAAQRQRDRQAQNRYVTDAEQMTGQIKALRAALGPKGAFKDALKKRLANIQTVLSEQLADLDKAEESRSKSLDADQLNNEISVGDSTTRNDSNRARERSSALAEAALQGAGESDSLKAQMMSLRNSSANQGEIDRAFHDGQRSINNSRIDLALDTHNARVNMVTDANADKEQLWTTFYNQVSDTQTQLGNALGQQAEYYGLAREAGANAGIHAGMVKTGSSSSHSSSHSGKGGKSVGGFTVKGGDNELSYDPGKGGGLSPWHGPSYRPEASSLDDPRAGGGTVASPLGGIKSGGTKGPGKLGKGLKGDEARATRASDRAFMASALAQGRSWKNPGLSGELENWEPPEQEVKQLPNSVLANARTTIAQKRPEGATLRSW